MNEKKIEFLTQPLREAKPLLLPEGFRLWVECDDEENEPILILVEVA